MFASVFYLSYELGIFCGIRDWLERHMDTQDTWKITSTFPTFSASDNYMIIDMHNLDTILRNVFLENRYIFLNHSATLVFSPLP